MLTGREAAGSPDIEDQAEGADGVAAGLGAGEFDEGVPASLRVTLERTPPSRVDRTPDPLPVVMCEGHERTGSRL